LPRFQLYSEHPGGEGEWPERVFLPFDHKGLAIPRHISASACALCYKEIRFVTYLTQRCARVIGEGWKRGVADFTKCVRTAPR
jgi:hypothetical protein